MKKTILFFGAIAFMLATSVQAQTFQVNTQKSVIKWLGKKIGGAHNGEIQLKEASFTVKENRITAGIFIMDMNSITNNDIEAVEYKEKLIGHLKSDDFFGVEKYPSAKLMITSSSVFINNVAKVKGDLTIKGITHPIEFEVSRNASTYSTELIINRSKFDVRYGSQSFFENLGDKAISDNFTLNISLSIK